MGSRVDCPHWDKAVQMVSRLQDVGMTTYGHADEPSVSAISQPGFQEQATERLFRFARMQPGRQLIRVEEQLIYPSDGKLICSNVDNQFIT